MYTHVTPTSGQFKVALSISNVTVLSAKLYRCRIFYTQSQFPSVCLQCHRVIPIWNSLSNHVVSAETVNTFKNRLDKFWLDQEVLYDYKTDLHGIGNRSIV